MKTTRRTSATRSAAPARARGRRSCPRFGRALDHPPRSLLTGLLTVFALFGDDVQCSVVQTSSRRPTLAKRRSASSPSDGASNADYIFSVTNAVVMTYFALEILANCTVHYDVTSSGSIIYLFCMRVYFLEVSIFGST